MEPNQLESQGLRVVSEDHEVSPLMPSSKRPCRKPAEWEIEHPDTFRLFILSRSAVQLDGLPYAHVQDERREPS
jgi:hypothetical protein